ncbi:uncharacterized protein TRUGW13939_03454 [Talaromyces rugulosus]|uniref:DUF7598 domain-containing protein n=1 Tax=Talaromyces rugulosus TaxID=121627 RepID=A0A7H8QTM0_TALRU|nr:uncharacterized protein TRUGW13939_03454 [Talaromyces rugulosus]QKX56353.1 hypothetical protein TRUGW13939_03454 [Talaromyces rugulosus]
MAVTALFKGSLAGPGYVILNVLRGINIIAFLDLIAASIVMLIKITLNNNFFFFEAVTHVITASLSIFLIISELPILGNFFNRYCPQLGQTAGFGPLAFVMIVLGVAVLGNLNNDDFSEKHLGLSMWRIVASAGILSMTMGIVNFIAGFIFADSANSVTARQVRAYGAVADKVVDRKGSQKSFQLSLNRDETLPTYRASNNNNNNNTGRSMSMRQADRIPLKISSPVKDRTDTSSSKYSSSEVDLTMPNAAHHPAYSNFV